MRKINLKLWTRANKYEVYVVTLENVASSGTHQQIMAEIDSLSGPTRKSSTQQLSLVVEMLVPSQRALYLQDELP